MGLLKHAILPLLGAVHALVFVSVVLRGKEEFARELGLLSEGAAMTDMESHLFGVLVFTHLLLFVNCVAGVFLENSHYRGMAAILEVIFFGGDLYDTYMVGLPTEALIVLFSVAFVGLVVHTNEPGIFTKDKKVKTN
jgi:hypothetical protein